VPNYFGYYNLTKTAGDLRNEKTGILMKNYSGIVSSKDVEDASFICLDNLSLGYNFRLPEGSPFSKIRLYFAGNRLFYLTKYKGADPEPRYADRIEDSGMNSLLVPGIDRRETWSRSRSITFGANLVF
jgi:iron complex outermembrane receptor protein